MSIYLYNLKKNNKGWVSEWLSEWLLLNAKLAFFSAISTREQDAFQWDDVDVNILHLDQFSANTQTQPSVGWNVAPFGHIILIYHYLFFLLKSKCVAGK